MKSYFVYLITTKDKNKTISYVGYTSDLKKRLLLHNTNKGAKFTRGRKWEVIYKRKYFSKSLAMKAEYLLKKDYYLRKKIKIRNKF